MKFPRSEKMAAGNDESYMAPKSYYSAFRMLLEQRCLHRFCSETGLGRTIRLSTNEPAEWEKNEKCQFNACVRRSVGLRMKGIGTL